MGKYKALTEMGIQHPEQIARHAVYTDGNTDILQIIYNRKKGSILPVSKKYRFERIKKSTLVDGGSRQTGIVYESAPEFQRALAELEELMDAKDRAQDVSKLIGEEVRLLEEDVAARIAYIKSLVEKV